MRGEGRVKEKDDENNNHLEAVKNEDDGASYDDTDNYSDANEENHNEGCSDDVYEEEQNDNENF